MSGRQISTLTDKAPCLLIKTSRIKSSRKKPTKISNLKLLGKDYKTILITKKLQDKL